MTTLPCSSLGAFLALSLSLGACGGDTSETSDSAEDGSVGGALSAGGSTDNGESGGAGAAPNSGGENGSGSTGSGASGAGAETSAGGAGGEGGSRSSGGGDASSGGSSIQCFVCGPPVLCGETCSDECGCCCTDGEGSTSEDGVALVCRDGCLAEADETSDPWTKFTSSSGSGLCPPETPCTLVYEVTPDQELIKIDGDAVEVFQMTDTDFAFINAHASDAGFRELMASGFDCGPPPTDVGASFALQTGAGEDWTQSVTGCAYGSGGDDAQVVEQIRSILDHY